VPEQIDATRAIRAGSAQRGDDCVGHRQGRVLDPGHDHRVRAGEVVERPGRADAEPARTHLRRLAANPHVIPVVSVGQADAPEHLARDRQVKCDHPMDGQNGNGVHDGNTNIEWNLPYPSRRLVQHQEGLLAGMLHFLSFLPLTGAPPLF